MMPVTGRLILPLMKVLLGLKESMPIMPHSIHPLNSLMLMPKQAIQWIGFQWFTAQATFVTGWLQLRKIPVRSVL